MNTYLHAIAREHVSTEWALWVEPGTGKYAVLFDSGNWVETDGSTAREYNRQFPGCAAIILNP